MTYNFCFPSSSINSMMANDRSEWPSDLNIALQVVSSFYASYFKSETNHPLEIIQSQIEQTALQIKKKKHTEDCNSNKYINSALQS